MKAVIVEIREKYVAALSDDGCIVKIKNNNYAIGQVIEMKKQITNKFKRIAICTASAVALVIAGGVYVYTTPYTYVSLDVNPSIEYSLNRFERVLSVKGVNSDGDEILKEITPSSLSNMKIDDALKITVEQLSQDGYFDGDVEGGIIISTSSEDLEEAEELATELGESVIDNTEENGDTVEVESISVGEQRVKEAKELGVTPGKLNLVQKLQASAKDPNSIDLQEWLNKPVKDIMHAIKENKKAEKENSSISLPDKEETDSDKAEINEENTVDKAVTNEEKVANQAQIGEEKAADKAVTNEEKVSNKAKTGEEKSADKAVSNQEKEANKAEVGKEKATEKKEDNQGKAPDKSENNEKKENSNGNSNGNNNGNKK